MSPGTVQRAELRYRGAVYVRRVLVERHAEGRPRRRCARAPARSGHPRMSEVAKPQLVPGGTAAMTASCLGWHASMYSCPEGCSDRLGPLVSCVTITCVTPRATVRAWTDVNLARSTECNSASIVMVNCGQETLWSAGIARLPFGRCGRAIS